MALLTNTSSGCVITHTKSLFARHGIPHIVVSDNGPCFSSREWKQFAQQYEFCYVTSRPHYPQSDGQAEKGVHILKQLLSKAADSSSDPYLALLSYCASPLQNGLSPGELLMNRKLRTTLPSYSSRSEDMKHEELRNKRIKQEEKQKAFYDVTAKSLLVSTVKTWSGLNVMTDGKLRELCDRNWPQDHLRYQEASSVPSEVHSGTPTNARSAGCQTTRTPDKPELGRSTREIKIFFVPAGCNKQTPLKVIRSEEQKMK
uniref:Integrase catalytic domain-containing protein n=1 Tax=Nothobranchius furzeri TaxID=105023 RepID=A0A8C6NY70_NOTFU